MFEENPCRWNALEVFQIHRSTTDRKTILDHQNETARTCKLQDQQVSLRDGSRCPIDEARLNRFRDRLDKPLLRLQEEQLVHEYHSFAGDQELLDAVRHIAIEAILVPAIAGEMLVDAVGEMLPTPQPSKMEDDLPWPEPPAALPIAGEALEVTILRDC